MAALLQTGAIASGQLWFLIGTVAFLAGTGAFLKAGAGSDSQRGLVMLSVGLTVAGVITYLLLSVGVGSLVVTADGSSRTVYWLQYADWLVTFPLVLLALGIIAGGSRRVVGTAIGFSVSLVVFGLASVLTTQGLAGYGLTTVRYALFGLSVLALVAIVGLLVRPLSRAAATQATEVALVYSMLRNIVIVLLALYPVVWSLTTLLEILPTTVALGSYLLLDLLLKVGVGWLVLSNKNALEQSSDSAPRTLGT